MAAEQSRNIEKMNLHDLPPPYLGNEPDKSHPDKSHPDTSQPDLDPVISKQPTLAAPGAVPVVTEYVVGPKPATMSCPSCKAEIVTRVQPVVTNRTHYVAACMCLLCGLLGVWVPYYCKRCQNADHYCPNCDAYIGSYSR